MKKSYKITYKDGVHYGYMTFTNKTQKEIEVEIQNKIKENNKNPNKNYHITRENFSFVLDN